MDIDVPLLLASLLFLVICLLAIGIMVHMKQIHYRRGLIGKIQSPDNKWVLPEEDAEPLALSGKPGSAFANFLSAIGVKVKPRQIGRQCRHQTQVFKGRFTWEKCPERFLGEQILSGCGLANGFFDCQRRLFSELYF